MTEPKRTDDEDVFIRKTIDRAAQPNISQVIGIRLGIDDWTGRWIMLTYHANRTFTLVAEGEGATPAYRVRSYHDDDDLN